MARIYLDIHPHTGEIMDWYLDQIFGPPHNMWASYLIPSCVCLMDVCLWLVYRWINAQSISVPVFKILLQEESYDGWNRTFWPTFIQLVGMYHFLCALSLDKTQLICLYQGTDGWSRGERWKKKNWREKYSKGQKIQGKYQIVHM